MENKKYTLIEFISGIFSILFLIFSFLSFGSYAFDGEKVKKYKENWNLSPITNIIEIDLNSNCPKNYWDFFSNEFPGNFKGCDCFNVKSNTYKKKIFNETCTKNQIKNDCKNINENDNINLNVWKGKKLCLERMEKKYNFFMLNQFKSKKNSCENGFKFCGVFDTKENILCLPENLSCPISNVFVDNEKKVNNYETIELSNDYYLHFSKRANEKIYLEFLANDKKFCFDGENNFGENDYILSKKKGEKECEKINKNVYDNRYEKIDEISSNVFYDENNITNKIIVLSGFEFPSDGESVKLFDVPYFSVENKCLNKIDFNNLINPNIKNSYKILNVLCIFCFSYNFYLIGIFAIFCFVDDSSDKKFFFCFIDVLKIIFLLVLIVICGVFLNRNGKILKNKNYFVNENCAETATNFAFDLAYKKLNDVNDYVKAIIFFAVLDVLIRIFYYVYFLCFEKENKEKIQ